MHLKKTLAHTRRNNQNRHFLQFLAQLILLGSNYIIPSMFLPTVQSTQDKNTCTEFTTADEMVDYFSTANKLIGSGAMDMADLLKEESNRKVAIADRGTLWTIDEKNQLKSMLDNYPGFTYFESLSYRGSLTFYKNEPKKTREIKDIPILIKEKNIDIVKESNGIFEKVEDLFKLPSITEISMDKRNIKDLKKWIISSLLIGKYCNISTENIHYFINHALHGNYGLYSDFNPNNKHIMFVPNIILSESNAALKPRTDHHIIEIKNVGFIYKFKQSEASWESVFTILEKNIRVDDLEIFTEKFIEFLNFAQRLFYKIDENGMPYNHNEFGGNAHLDYSTLLNNESN